MTVSGSYSVHNIGLNRCDPSHFFSIIEQGSFCPKRNKYEIATLLIKSSHCFFYIFLLCITLCFCFINM